MYEPALGDARDDARLAYSNGQTAYREGRYAEALAHFQTAYTAIANPVVLVAMGTALERLQRAPEALARYQAYLQADPTGAEAATARARVTALTAPTASPTSGQQGAGQIVRSAPPPPPAVDTRGESLTLPWYNRTTWTSGRISNGWAVALGTGSIVLLGVGVAAVRRRMSPNRRRNRLRRRLRR